MNLHRVVFSTGRSPMRCIRTLRIATGFKQFILAASVCLLLVGLSRAAIIISEVDPIGSSSSYGADWFELTNTGAAAVDITGWKMDDGSNSFGLAVALRGGITQINPGQSVVFAEGDSTGTTDAAIQTSFINAWFGGTAPAGFTMGFYGGSGVGLSSSNADGVNLFDSGGNAVTTASVSYGAGTVPGGGATFDNAAGLAGTISAASVAGVNGAFAAGGEVGSPGTVPEPGSALLLVLGGTGLFAAPFAGVRRRR
jgi:Lamin Tail Domain